MKQRDYEGRLIAVEGPDGSGTTTQSRRLAQRLGAVYTAEHGERRSEEAMIGEKVEEMISSDSYSAEAIALAFAADRMVHLEEKVVPHLKDGKDVVTDRYYHSSLVYQPALGADFSWVREINREALEPDITFLLDVEAETGMERIDSRGSDGNIFENLDFQQEVAARYRQLPGRLDENITVVDGSLSKQKVFEAIMEALQDRFDSM